MAFRFYFEVLPDEFAYFFRAIGQSGLQLFQEWATERPTGFAYSLNEPFLILIRKVQRLVYKRQEPA